MDRYIHHVPGRLRLRYDALKENPCHAGKIRCALAALPGVETCSVNLATGSILCRYDSSATKFEPILAVLERAVLTVTPASLAAPPVHRPAAAKHQRGVTPPGRRIGQKVASWLLEQSLERAFVLLMRAAL